MSAHHDRPRIARRGEMVLVGMPVVDDRNSGTRLVLDVPELGGRTVLDTREWLIGFHDGEPSADEVDRVAIAMACPPRVGDSSILRWGEMSRERRNIWRIRAMRAIKAMR